MQTLIEAVVLVFLVMLLFLQSWRATLIPTIAVPVVLLGTFAILFALGFAEARVSGGMAVAQAALEAAKLRLRPILMTSLAFVFGVLPLAISSGAGSGGRHAIGRAVVGGMLSGTLLAILFVPVFFVLVKRLFTPREKQRPAAAPSTPQEA